MKTINTSEATGPALDWLVAKCQGITKIDRIGCAWVRDPDEPHFSRQFKPSTDWSQGGPIVEKEKMQLSHSDGVGWGAYSWTGSSFSGHGPAPLIAAMRCYVASRLGDTVEVPEELT